MKKTVTVTIIATVLATTQVSAQSFVKNLMGRIYGGPKVEANVSNFFLSDMAGMESKMNIGGSAGGFIGFRLSENFSFQEDLLIHYQTSQLEQEGQKGDFSYLGAEFSLYAIGHWRVGNGCIIAGAGPFVGYGLDVKYKAGNVETDLYEKNGNGDKPFQPFSAGAAVMLGYELKCGLQFNTSYKIGIIDQLDAKKADASMLPCRISLGVAYRFSPFGMNKK